MSLLLLAGNGEHSSSLLLLHLGVGCEGLFDPLVGLLVLAGRSLHVTMIKMFTIIIILTIT